MLLSVEEMHEAIGPCPVCGRRAWLNDIPVQASCWGPPEAEHPEMVCTVPTRKGFKEKPKWERSED